MFSRLFSGPSAPRKPADAAFADSWLELPGGQLFWMKSRCTVGRQADNDLVFEGPTLSRHHALLSATTEGYLVTDLHSSNGTSVNRTRISRPVLLHDGDEIHFGDVAVRYRCTLKLEIREPGASPAVTQRFDQMQTRPCWLLLIDLAGYTALNEKLGGETALRQWQAWITDVRPLIEQHGGQINGYLGGAIFAYWSSDAAKPAPVLAALQVIEGYRPRSPLPFRLIVHHGPVLFDRSGHREELSGQEVAFIFRIKKIAKGFGTHALLSEAAMTTLRLEGRCTSYGRSAVDGMNDFFTFYSLPRDLTAPAARR
jgi:pSer/pThr/pTyr-binding forkhead associated (FHA) protein